jgi:hypothetical protein
VLKITTCRETLSLSLFPLLLVGLLAGAAGASLAPLQGNHNQTAAVVPFSLVRARSLFSDHCIFIFLLTFLSPPQRE